MYLLHAGEGQRVFHRPVEDTRSMDDFELHVLSHSREASNDDQDYHDIVAFQTMRYPFSTRRVDVMLKPSAVDVFPNLCPTDKD